MRIFKKKKKKIKQPILQIQAYKSHIFMCIHILLAPDPHTQARVRLKFSQKDNFPRFY